MNVLFEKFSLPEELQAVVYNSPSVIIPESKEVLFELIFGNEHTDKIEVIYDVDGRSVKEAEVVRCKNGAAVNFVEDYMRRRDPDCMRIADNLPTDKPRFEDVYGYDFSVLREETLRWLTRQELILVPFKAGGYQYGYDSVLVCPRNAAFFAFALSQLQAFVEVKNVEHFTPRAVIYVAPPFRNTRFDGKQVVVHSRHEDLHEIFSYNLYPGPSAKKGIYSVLLDIGEQEGWVTAHASAARIITPYENEMVMMHEGASGGGKSELLQDVPRAQDGRVLLGHNIQTDEERFISMSDTCTIEPVTDDMAICHPSFQKNSGKLALADGEDGWFVRVDGITEYGCDPMYEKIAIHSKEPLVFFNIAGVPRATCLPWEHTIDTTGKPCPNPRVIIPRRMIHNIVWSPVEVDVRSFGVRMPPNTAKTPSYGIMGLMHIIPPALAWLWRLVAPRGFNNPSINGGSALASEGVGSYWPFATGKRVAQANLLLEQIINCSGTRYVLIPNQHIGVWKVGFAAEWISREYLARRGGVNMKMDRLVPARCPLLGYALKEMKVDGQQISSKFLRPETQETLGEAGYDKGAKILNDFFARELAVYDVEELHPVGKQILECFKRGGSIQDYCDIIPLGLQ
ncbi:DUF4914 family protein [Pseudoflavonifractor phocaeensis]|uniref:DUF4914 family protein n=1 Tax=Pseudoflavonifractor phocaeensis TaxID=1870988 RepID=UPI00210875C0|nr:DUF4914 family protein [Pseudoflavonifractor phocaeensis]MCQ4865649.1 DUF4914 family protein [Pseudoflavonifractor phocaeensis]